MPTNAQIEQALINAHKAGDTEAAKALANALKSGQNYGPAQTEEPGVLGSLASSAAQGLTLGFSDELAGFVDDNWKQSMRDYQDRVDEHRPGLAIAGEIGGALIPAIATLPFTGGTGAVASLGRVAAKQGAKELLKKSGKAGLVGGIYGGIAGAGYSDESLTENPLGLLEDSATGAAIGAPLGFAIPLAGAGFKAGGRKVLDTLPMEKVAESVGARKVAESMRHDGLTPESAMQRLQEMGPGATLADLGPNMLGRARGAGAFMGETRKAIQDTMKDRSKQASGRFQGLLQKAFGQEEDFYGAMKGLDAEMRQTSRPLYQKAYAADIPLTDTLTSLSKRPLVADAMQRGKRIAANEGVELAEREAPTAQMWDYVKRGLDDVIEDHTDAVTGKVKNEGRIAIRLKRELLDELDTLNPAYKAAREAYAGPASNQQALVMGRKFMNEATEVTGEQIAEMSEGERAYFRAGAMRYLHERLATAKNPATEFERLLRSGKLKTVFPDKESYGAFEKAAETEITFRDTANQLLGGSPTARIEAEKLDLGAVPGAVGDIARGNYLNAAANLASQARNRFAMPTERLRGEVGSIMMEQNPTIQEQILLQMIKRGQGRPQVPTLLGSPLPAGNVGGLLASQ